MQIAEIRELNFGWTFDTLYFFDVANKRLHDIERYLAVALALGIVAPHWFFSDNYFVFLNGSRSDSHHMQFAQVFIKCGVCLWIHTYTFLQKYVWRQKQQENSQQTISHSHTKQQNSKCAPWSIITTLCVCDSGNNFIGCSAFCVKPRMV